MPNSSFDRITIIFNPGSTGDAPDMAKKLHAQLAERVPETPADLAETEAPGHAETIAKAAAKATARPLIVSVSGDGGYHEVVNGVMAAGNPEAVAAVHAAGNANDHRSSTREQPLIDAIIKGKKRQFDLLKVDFTNQTRYAHSYLGLGISPVVAVELNRHTLTALKELKLVIKTFRAYRPFQIKTAETTLTLDSLVCANIPRMAKVLKLSDDAEAAPDDGRFELIIAKHTSKLRLIGTALRLMTVGPAAPPKLQTYAFDTVKPMPMQLDGEVVELEPGTTVTVTSAKAALCTLA